MQFPFRCPECAAVSHPEYRDDGIHRLRCRCGQEYCVFLRKHRFEMLFDIGARALLDGYGREAVANFAASFERLLEFYLQATTLSHLSHLMPLEQAEAKWEQNWKLMSAQSERQMGAFMAAWLLHQGEAPAFLLPKPLRVQFRNRVIHQGYLPAREEVLAYAQTIFEATETVLRALGDTAEHAALAQERHFAALAAALPAGVRAVTIELPGVFQASRYSGRVAAPGARSAPARPLYSPEEASETNDARNLGQALQFGASSLQEMFVKREQVPREAESAE